MLDAHLACAAYESPLDPDDDQWWDHAPRRRGAPARARDRLEARSAAPRPQPKAVWAAGFPSHGVGLRRGRSRELRIALADGTLVGTVDATARLRVVHPGAIYLHQGRRYRVEELDLDEGWRWSSRPPATSTTQVRTQTNIAVLGDELRRAVGRADLHLGTVEVTPRSPATSAATSHRRGPRRRAARPAARPGSSPGPSGT